MGEYNPLDYRNLTRNIVQELMNQPCESLPLAASFAGAGVYALFYGGNLHEYQQIKSPPNRQPIYVGKAVPAGARKGAVQTKPGTDLFKRIREHTASIESASNLRVQDFCVRYLVVTPLWITMAERFLIENFQPIWNVWLDGFGNHPPGKGRPDMEVPWWDAMHPGRIWAARLKQTRSPKDAIAHVAEFFKLKETRPDLIEREAKRAAEAEAAKED